MMVIFKGTHILIHCNGISKHSVFSFQKLKRGQAINLNLFSSINKTINKIFGKVHMTKIPL